jgi:hypothetical protein
MQKNLARIFGGLVVILGLAGLLAGDKQMFGFMNVDLALDIARLGLAALLFYAVYGARDEGFIRGSLLLFGIAYLGLAVIGMISPTVGGLLSHQLSAFDIVFHLGAGIVAVAGAMWHERSAASHA